MGYSADAVCRDCGKAFGVNNESGFSSHHLCCDKCGKTKGVTFDELGELHLRYLKGTPYSSVDEEERLWPILHGRLSEIWGKACVGIKAKKNSKIKPISTKEYHMGVEAYAGKCSCNGQYTLNAPTRCPKCHSTNIKEYEPDIFFN